MPQPSFDPSPAPWTFADRMYRLAHCLIDRDGRVIGCNLPIGNGPLMEQAPAMAALLRELVAGAAADDLRKRAVRILNHIEQYRMREPGEDDELAEALLFGGMSYAGSIFSNASTCSTTSAKSIRRCA